MRIKKKTPGFKNFLANTVFGNIEGNKFEGNSDGKKEHPSPIYIPKNSNVKNRSKTK
ncbi:hypothetical protein ACWOFR_10235 [Carnobacterium gallinarum]|uniref:hypothetical protein n=1 Tax=Carnobacterium gallinarum TaxID=2749 RepID=UPI000A8BF206|nr:hypothetical protein [Carnobacterium gallinarum]